MPRTASRNFGYARGVAMDMVEFERLHALDIITSLRHKRHLVCTMEDARLHNYVSNLIAGSQLSIATSIEPDPTAYALCFLEIQARGSIVRECQRCLGPVDEPVDLVVRWQLMRAVLPNVRVVEGYEPLASSDYDNIIALFAQEIMLYLPDIPKHQPQKCLPQGAQHVDNTALPNKPIKHGKPSAFSALAPLFTERLSGEN